jgi:hypothetical protein
VYCGDPDHMVHQVAVDETGVYYTRLSLDRRTGAIMKLEPDLDSQVERSDPLLEDARSPRNTRPGRSRWTPMPFTGSTRGIPEPLMENRNVQEYAHAEARCRPIRSEPVHERVSSSTASTFVKTQRPVMARSASAPCRPRIVPRRPGSLPASPIAHRPPPALNSSSWRKRTAAHPKAVRHRWACLLAHLFSAHLERCPVGKAAPMPVHRKRWFGSLAGASMSLTRWARQCSSHGYGKDARRNVVQLRLTLPRSAK